MAITLADLESRKQRLEQLTLGFMREVAAINKHDDPLLYRERLAYLTAIHDAWNGIETARVVLSKVLQRMTKPDGN